MKINQTKYKTIRAIGLALTLFTFFQQGFSTTYYSKGGNWNDAMSWVTGSCASRTNAGTYPISGDEAVICGGNTIIIEGNMTCQKVDVIDGTISYSTTVSSFLYVAGGDLNIEKNGKIEYTGTLGLTHNLFIDGNLSNKGQLNLRSNASNYVGLHFTGSIPSVALAVGGTYELAYLRMNKNIPSILVDLQDPALSKALTDGSKLVGRSSIDLNRGIFRHNNTEEMGNVYQPGMTLNDPMVISDRVTIEVFQGKVTIPINNITYLRGKIRLAGGTLAVSTGIGALTPYGLYYQGNTSAITLQNGGVLEIAGAFKDDPATPSSTYLYIIGTGKMDVGIVKPTVETFKLTPESKFHMSWGTITLHNSSDYSHPSVVTPTDFELMANYNDVTGGQVVFGGIYTAPSPQVFRFTGCKQFPGLVLGGDPLVPITLMPYTHPCQFSSLYGWKFNVLSLEVGAGKTFDMRDVRTGSDHTAMNITSVIDSMGFYNNGFFNPRSSWVIFSGRYQYIVGIPSTKFSSLQVGFDPINTGELWTGPILKTDIAVSDTAMLLRNFDLNQHEFKIGISDNRPGFMSVNPNCGVFNGILTRYFKKSKNKLDFTDALNDYTSTDLPFYITDLQSISLKKEDGTSYKIHLDHNFATRTFRVAATTAPQESGYISVDFQGYKNDVLPSRKELLLLANYMDFGSKINAITGCHWSTSTTIARTGIFEVAAKNSGLIVDNSDIQQLRLLYTVGSSIYGPGMPGTNSGSCILINPAFPYYHIFEQPTRFAIKSGYAVNGYIVRRALSSLFSNFFVATLTDLSREWNWGRFTYDYAFPLAFRYVPSSDPYPFPTLAAWMMDETIVSIPETESTELTIFPNPIESGKMVSITLPSEVVDNNLSIRLINMFGEIIVEDHIDSVDRSRKVSLDLSKRNIKEGMYMLLISQGDRIWQKRLLIK